METVIRVFLIYVFIVIGLRVLGKREFGEMSPLELVTLLLIPEMVSQALVREDFSMTNALVGITTIFSLVFLTSLVSARFKTAQEVIQGTPTVLAQDGKLIPENLLKERVTPSDVYSEMHMSGLDELSQVKWAILETDGKISIVPVDPNDRRQRQRSEIPAG